MARQNKQELLDAIGDAFRVSQNRSDLFDEIAGELLGLNRTDMRCIDVITRLGRVSAGDLAREAGITTGGATAVVDRLERLGFVHRVRDPEDRRRVWVEPTARIFERTVEIWGPLKQRWETRAGDLPRDQLEFMLEFMTTGNELMTGEIERVRAMRDRDAGE